MKNILKKRYDVQNAVFSSSMDGISSLSNQERELLKNSINTTKRLELSELMYKSPHTIDAYFKSVFKKLDLKSRSEVQFFATEFKNEI